jgi:S-DNA-T family DNA segregation ATPase FtsK/SpoIIIE
MSGDRSEGPIVPGLTPEAMIPGRGHMARRGQAPVLVQVARFDG